jgi:uncharacterized surface protein with fasciclin (FAS1) repeats
MLPQTKDLTNGIQLGNLAVGLVALGAEQLTKAKLDMPKFGFKTSGASTAAYFCISQPVLSYSNAAKMDLKSVILASLGIFILAATQTVPKDTILAVLSAHSELSSLSSLVNSLPPLVQQFNVADNFTFLAPTNDAVLSWLTMNRTQEYIQASLQYHLLNGIYPSASIPSTQIFIPSALTNVSYCNVTGGQRVKAYNDGQLVFGSALNTISNAVTVVGSIIFLNTLLTATDDV